MASSYELKLINWSEEHSPMSFYFATLLRLSLFVFHVDFIRLKICSTTALVTSSTSDTNIAITRRSGCRRGTVCSSSSTRAIRRSLQRKVTLLPKPFCLCVTMTCSVNRKNSELVQILFLVLFHPSGFIWYSLRLGFKFFIFDNMFSLTYGASPAVYY